MEFLLLKDLHRLPPLPQGQTSVLTRYFTANNTAAQRLRAVGLLSLISLSADRDWLFQVAQGTAGWSRANFGMLSKAGRSVFANHIPTLQALVAKAE